METLRTKKIRPIRWTDDLKLIVGRNWLKTAYNKRSTIAAHRANPKKYNFFIPKKTINIRKIENKI